MTLPVSPDKRGARDRHERAGGMRWTPRSRRRTWLRRTAKACGPDAAVLASSLVVSPASDGGKRAVHRGELVISRKAIAQGRPDALRWTCMLMRALLVHIAHEIAGAARIRHSLRPLTIEGVRFPANLGRNASREGEPICRMHAQLGHHPRHPEARALRCTCTAGRASKDEPQAQNSHPSRLAASAARASG